jgi:hypothetical protein
MAMLKKILVIAGSAALLVSLAACQSEEGTTLPSIGLDEDEDYPIYGYVYDGPNTVPYATVDCYDYSVPYPPEHFATKYTDGSGRYQLGAISDLKNRQIHDMVFTAVKNSKSGSTDTFTWDGSYVRIDIDIE